MSELYIQATTCPLHHEDCTPISDVVTDDMPDQCYQQYFCPKCEASYEVIYMKKYVRFLDMPKEVPKHGD